MAIGTGAAILGAALIGGASSMFGASKAASAQTAAAERATAAQMEMFRASQANAAPFIAGGQGSFNELTGRMPQLTAPFSPTQLEATPGYQWTLGQLLKATQNSYAAKGLGSSGPAIAGAQDRAFGLASTTYQQALDNYMKQNQQVYNMLMGPAQVGAGAASGTMQTSAQVGSNIGNNITGQGNAQAGAWMAGTGAFGNMLGTGANYLLQQDMMNRLVPPRIATEATANPLIR